MKGLLLLFLSFPFFGLAHPSKRCSYNSTKTGSVLSEYSVECSGAVEVMKDTIPFVLTMDNNILVEMVLNRKDTLRMMLHTAVNTVSITEKALDRIMSVKFGDSVKSTSWGGEGRSRKSTGNRLDISTLSYNNVEIWTTKHSGPSSDGKFGLNLFGGGILEIDFDREVLVFHSKLPDEVDDYGQLDVHKEGELYFVYGLISIDQKAMKKQFLLHSGYAGTLLFDDDFSNAHRLDDYLKVIDRDELRDAQGNVLVRTRATLPEFSFGNSQFTDLTVGFFNGSIGKQKMSVLGGELIKRFNFMIDLENNRFYIAQSKYHGDPMPSNLK